jgi:hypothetical protein
MPYHLQELQNQLAALVTFQEGQREIEADLADSKLCFGFLVTMLMVLVTATKLYPTG